MQETFIELVPRTEESLRRDIKQFEAMDIPFHGYNFPELKRQKTVFLTPEEMMRKREMVAANKKLALHLRTQERSVVENIERIRLAATHGVDIVLLVTGDAFDVGKDPATCAHDVIDEIIEPIESIQIAVGADVYHANWGRWARKINGIQRGIVRSVFTQPVFRSETLITLREKTTDIPSENVYAGITWITTAASRDYWHRTNHVPLAHLPSGESDDVIRRNSIAESAEMLRLAKQQGFSQYVMLMRGTLDELEQIFSLSEKSRVH